MKETSRIYKFKREDLKGYTLEAINCAEDLNLSIPKLSTEAKQETIGSKVNNGQSEVKPLFSYIDLPIPAYFLDFFDLYEIIFDDNDEREPKEEIIKRIVTNRDYSTTINICKNALGIVIGGFVLEYYERSNCCILTYLFLKEDERRNGLGKALIEEGVRWVVQNHLKKENKDKVDFIDAIFLEIETPLYTVFLDGDEKIREQKEKDIKKRSEFFSKKVKAKWVDIPYVQPRLPHEVGKPDKNQAFHLLLLTLPNIAKQANPFLLDKAVLLAFITEFYLTVEQKYRTDDENSEYEAYFKKILNYCENLRKLPHLRREMDFTRIFNRAVQIDLNLARILLAVEILDAIDDLDPGNTLSQEKDSFSNLIDKELFTRVNAANQLRGLQIKLKSTFNSTADEIRDIKKEPYEDKCKLAKSIKKIISDNENELRKALKDIFADFKKIYLSEKFEDINNDFYLREVPKFKKPLLNFDRTAISIHLIKRQDAIKSINADIETKEEKKRTYCPYFHSFEKDLFALRHHNNSPYVSKVYKTFKIKITFPYEVQFLSEGRQETIFINAEKENAVKYPHDPSRNENESKIHYDEYTKEVQCKLNYIYFKESGIRIWELVFNNFIRGDNTTIPLNEFEIIQLSKFFTGKQERHLPAFLIMLDDPDAQNDGRVTEIIEYLRGLCANKNAINESFNSNYAILCGTVQIDTKAVKILNEEKDDESNKNEEKEEGKKKDTFIKLFEEEEKITEHNKWMSVEKKLNLMQESYLRDNVSDEQLLRNLYGIDENKENKRIYYTDLYSNIRLSHEGEEQRDFERNYTENNYLKTIMNFMCGASLGIFDYDRMGYPEVLDTLKPMQESATDDYIIILQRSSLICFCHEDSVFETAWYTIGISPYLIIPNSVLAHNHYIAAEKIDKLREYGLKDKLTKEEKKTISEILRAKTPKKIYPLKVRISEGIKLLRENSITKEVFNYATEIEIYSYGMKIRTTDQYLDESREADKLFDSQISEFRELKRRQFELFLEFLIGFIGLFQIKSVVRELLELTFLNDIIDKVSLVFLKNPSFLIESQTKDVVEKVSKEREAVEFILITIIYWSIFFLIRWNMSRKKK